MYDPLSRLETLLEEAWRFPIPVACDYLVDEGLSVLADWRPHVRGRMDRLRRLVKHQLWILRPVVPSWWHLGRWEDGALVEMAYSDSPDVLATTFVLVVYSPQLTFFEATDPLYLHAIGLRDLGRKWGMWFSSEDLRDLAVLLWFAARCYRRR